jgi:hypothetical protein
MTSFYGIFGRRLACSVSVPSVCYNMVLKWSALFALLSYCVLQRTIWEIANQLGTEEKLLVRFPLSALRFEIWNPVLVLEQGVRTLFAFVHVHGDSDAVCCVLCAFGCNKQY